VITVSAVGIASSVISVIAKTKGYAECAEKSAYLGQRYGHALGDLMDALDSLPDGQDRAREAVSEMEQIRSEKMSLHPYPTELQKKLDKIRATEARHHRQALTAP
jgi:hypothetical protein